MASAIDWLSPEGNSPQEFLLKLAEGVGIKAGDLLYAGQLLRSRIRERTERGVDYQGSSFAPYSEGYAKQKARKLGNSGTVDLFGPDHHPHMLNAIVVRVGGISLPAQSQASPSPWAEPAAAGRFEIGFYGQDEAERARVHNEGGEVPTRLGRGTRVNHKFGDVMHQKRGGKLTARMPRREFFRASAEDLQLMEFAIGERLDARANQPSGRRSA